MHNSFDGQLHFSRTKVALGHKAEGEQRLARVGEEAERLVLHLPKAGAAQVQDRLTACRGERLPHPAGRQQTKGDLEDGTANVTGDQ